VPTAANITLRETLDLLDGQFGQVSKGVSDGAYAFWLGSGISRDKVIGLDGVLAKLIEFLRVRATADPACPYKSAFDKVVGLANPSKDELAQIDLAVPATTWPCMKELLPRLWKQYSAVLSTEVPPEGLDYLLWVGLEFPDTFGTQEPDVEHFAIAVLALEGVVEDVATPNWDGLIEAAMAELGHPDAIFKITVTGEDLRTPHAAQATLYKFHGCARRAIADEPKYRPLLVARSGQILAWIANDTFKVVRDQLAAVIQTSRSLMIGLSAQDVNIQTLFGKVGAHKGWKWNDEPTPIVISAEELGDDQKTLLEVAYGEDYEPNRQAIWDAARLRAFAKPLLICLVLCVLTEKLKTLLSDVNAPNLDPAAHAALADGLTHLRNRIAEAGDADRPSLIRAIAAGLARGRHQLQDGVSAPGVPKYYPIDSQPAHLMKGKQALAASGQREASAALSLIGLDVTAATWTVTVDDPSLARSGTLRLASSASEARVFLAANDDAVGTLLEACAFSDSDEDVVVICSKKVTDRQQRSPSATYRSGSLGPRYISLGTMLSTATDLDDLRDAFRKEVSV
jgi:hypothetical protein